MTKSELDRLRRVYYTPENGTEDTILQLLNHIRDMHPPVRDSAGATLSRKDVIDGLRTCYDEMLARERLNDSSLTGYPDMEAMLDHIEKHGLEPKE